jgi:hypothetical protein
VESWDMSNGQKRAAARIPEQNTTREANKALLDGAFS